MVLPGCTLRKPWRELIMFSFGFAEYKKIIGERKTSVLGVVATVDPVKTRID